MAGAASQHHHGAMDISEQAATFSLVMGMTKWGSLFVGALVLFLVLWFCTGAGFGGALVTAAIVVALGVFFLRSRTQAAAAH
jgi:hypothetical protein